MAYSLSKSSSSAAAAAASVSNRLHHHSAAVLLICALIVSHVSIVDVTYYGSHSTLVIYAPHRRHLAAGLSSDEICTQYGGSCVETADCSTINLYAKYRHSVLSCNSTTICCLSATNFYSLYGHFRTIHVLRRRRRRRYKRPWRGRRRRYW